MTDIVTTQARRFDDFQSALEASDTDKILIHDGTGTKTITAANFKADLLATLDELRTTVNMLTFPGAGPHNSIFRGKNMGDHVTPEQWAAIAVRTYEGLYIGDYWTINGIEWQIAACEYYYNTGQTEHYTIPHIVIVPRVPLYNALMNADSTTTGGYVGSEMRTIGLEQAKTIANAAFPGHVLTHRTCLVNAVTGGRPSGVVWVDGTVDLMSAIMMWGSAIFSPVSDGINVPSNETLTKTQLPLMLYQPELIRTSGICWLRDVVSNYTFAGIDHLGVALSLPANVGLGVRPYFLIG